MRLPTDFGTAMANAITIAIAIAAGRETLQLVSQRSPYWPYLLGLVCLFARYGNSYSTHSAQTDGRTDSRWVI